MCFVRGMSAGVYGFGIQGKHTREADSKSGIGITWFSMRPSFFSFSSCVILQ